MQIAIPKELIEIVKQKPETAIILLASFFQFGLQQEKGMVLKDEHLWSFLLEQLVKLDAERVGDHNEPN